MRVVHDNATNLSPGGGIDAPPEPSKAGRSEPQKAGSRTQSDPKFSNNQVAASNAGNLSMDC